MRIGSCTPSRLAEIQLELSSNLFTLAEELANIEVLWADWWVEQRKSHSSDKATDIALETTKDGKRRIILKYQIKFLERVISSIKRRLDIAKQEAWNQV